MPNSLTPLMRQYLDLKQKYQDCLLFFRLGDFYEMFFEDAKLASKELEIVLTGRDGGLEERIPMCGVPYHSVDSYINKLISAGHKVAICEQMTDPKLSRGLVERDVIRVITPGTVIEQTMLDESKNNYLMCIFIENDTVGYSYADVSTGGFFVGEIQKEYVNTQLTDEAARINPSEILANDALLGQKSLLHTLSSTYYLNQYPDWAFEYNTALSKLLRHFNVASLKGFGCEHYKYGIRAAGALLCYLEETQKNSLAHITNLRPVSRYDHMVLDASSRRNLELTKPLSYGGDKKFTLLGLLDKTKTAMGARMLREWIEQPLQKKDSIEKRLDAVGELKDDLMKRSALRDMLHGIYDMERLTSRISYNTATARDCAALRQALVRLPAINYEVSLCSSPALKKLAASIDPMSDILELLQEAIADEPPLNIKDGGVIKKGYNAKVDELSDLAENSRQWLLKMEQDEREASGIKNLKIGYNKVFGYYIELTKSYKDKAPFHYHRKQTLANAERFVTPQLKELEEKILDASQNLLVLEQELFEQVRAELQSNAGRLQKTAALIAQLDCILSLSEIAALNNYCKPQMNDEGHIKITGGRHPVVEKALRDEFIPNDTLLDNQSNRLIILTGPNMAGKSTYMRQIALITLMAHVGSFVPAASAQICVVDRIMTRVGASDDLSSGQSTFMVEMSEMANILHTATSRSLLIIDEIGRGTSTFDGLSIAWSVLEHIANELKAKTLFATHYHELSELEDKLDGIQNYRTAVKEVGEDILFLRKVVSGGADKSFGIQVARLAGLPGEVIGRAKEILKMLESTDINKSIHEQMPNEKAANSPPRKDMADEMLEELAQISVDSLTPLEALNKLNELNRQAKRIRSL